MILLLWTLAAHAGPPTPHLDRAMALSQASGEARGEAFGKAIAESAREFAAARAAGEPQADELIEQYLVVLAILLAAVHEDPATLGEGELVPVADAFALLQPGVPDGAFAQGWARHEVGDGPGARKYLELAIAQIESDTAEPATWYYDAYLQLAMLRPPRKAAALQDRARRVILRDRARDPENAAKYDEALAAVDAFGK